MSRKVSRDTGLRSRSSSHAKSANSEHTAIPIGESPVIAPAHSGSGIAAATGSGFSLTSLESAAPIIHKSTPMQLHATAHGHTAAHGHGYSPDKRSVVADGAGEGGEEDEGNPRLLLALFVGAVFTVWMLYTRLPDMLPEERARLTLPRSIPQLQELAKVVLKYRDDNYAVVVGFFAAVYIFLQAFAVPGAIFLSILAGPLFGVARGLFVVSLVATSGSSICYMLSKTLGGPIIRRRFPALLERFRGMVQGHRDNLFFYMLFLRISPILPNWFVSVSSPLLNVPLHVFAGATFIGLMPGNYLHVTTGMGLSSLAGDGPMLNMTAVLTLFAVAFLALIPVLCKSRLEAMGFGSGSGGMGAGAEGQHGPDPLQRRGDERKSELVNPLLGKKMG